MRIHHTTDGKFVISDHEGVIVSYGGVPQTFSTIEEANGFIQGILFALTKLSLSQNKFPFS